MTSKAMSARIEDFKAQGFRLMEGDHSRLGQLVALFLLNLILLNLFAVDRYPF